jgi:GxxExxY protein
MEENRIASLVIGAAIEVHRSLGPGMLESAYARALAHEFGLSGIPYRSEVPVALRYKGLRIEGAYRVDFLVDDRLVVELKSVEKLRDEHRAQLLTYLRWTSCRLGLLLNFNATQMRHGISRVVNQL